MWLLGFSTTNPGKLWVIPAIIMVIFFTVMLRKFAVYLEAQARAVAVASNGETQTDLEKGGQDHIISRTKCSMWCTEGVIRTYALEELKMATRDFRIQIGFGATSFVYLAELGDGRFGAVKRVMEEKGGSRKIFLDEVSVLLRISHPNLVGLLGFCLDKGNLNNIILHSICKFTFIH